MKKILLLATVVLPLLLLLQSFDESQSSSSPLADTLCFARDILPIFNSNCSMAKCHDAATHADGWVLTSYTNVMKGIRANNPTLSSLYRQIVNGTMPQAPYPKVPDSLRNRILGWINAGALNQTCTDAGCDTTNISYLKTIKPMIQVNCVGCHQTYLAGGGVNLADDANNDLIKMQIYNSVNHTAGVKAMPENLAKLSACQITQFRKWANDELSTAAPTDQPLQPVLTVSDPGTSGQHLIRIRLASTSPIRLNVYRSDGREIAQLVDGVLEAGTHERMITSELSRGLYLVRMSVGDKSFTAKFMH